MTPRNIGVVFGPTLFKSADPLQGLADIPSFNSIVEKLVEHFELLFSHDVPESLQEASMTAGGYEDASRGVAIALYDYDGATEDNDYYLPLIEGEALESVRKEGCKQGGDGRGKGKGGRHRPSLALLLSRLSASPRVLRWPLASRSRAYVFFHQVEQTEDENWLYGYSPRRDEWGYIPSNHVDFHNPMSSA